MQINHDDVLRQLRDFGLLVDGPLKVASGSRSVRCRVDGGDREKRGWYRLHEWMNRDGELMLVGSFGIYQGDNPNTQKVELTKRCADCHREIDLKAKECPGCGSKTMKRRELSEDEKAAFKARMAEDKRRAAAEEAARHAKAAHMAELAWRKCKPEGESPYLARKQIKAHGVRFSPQGNLVIPLMDVSGRVHGLQVIYPEKKKIRNDGEPRDKDFWPFGHSKEGKFHMLGGLPDGVLIIAEGYATAASLHEATGLPVAVAFDAGNLLPVAIALHKKYPRAKIIIAADDDYLQKCKHCKGLVLVDNKTCPHCGNEHEKQNPGITRANAAAMAVGGTVLKPVFADERPVDRKGSTDFNDLHVAEGLPVVIAQVQAHLTGSKIAISQRAARAENGALGGGEKRLRRAAQAVMDLGEIVDRFVPLDDGTGDYVFDTWTNKVAKKSQMLALLPAGVRGDDIKRHPCWIERGAFYMDQVGFDPSGNDSNVKLNTWQGWPMKPAAGKCEQLLDLMAYLCGKEANGSEVYEWLLDWMAYPLQNPGAKMASAVIMHGPQGTGKSTVFQTLAKIYGDYATVLNQRGLEDKFNSDWSDSKLFILAEEVVTRAEMWHIKNELKELVTGEWIRINPKNVAAYRQRNQVNIAYLSNENQPLPLDNDDRRHLVIYTPPALSAEFYDALNIELDNGGVAAFYDFLLRRDISAFHPKKRPPMTEAKRQLIALSAPSEIRFSAEWISGEIGLPVCPAMSGDVYAAYQRWCKLSGEAHPRTKNVFLSTLGNLAGWHKTRGYIYPSPTSTSTKQVMMVFPPLEAVEREGRGQPAGVTDARYLTDSAECFYDGLKNYQESLRCVA